MILILPLLVSWIMLIIKNESDHIIAKYGGLISLIYILNVSIGLNNFQIIITLLIMYWTLRNSNDKDYFSIYVYSLLFFMSIVFIFNANSLLAFFISIELISFIMITFINLYIQDKYPGILYYLFSGLFSALFILSLGYLYMGYTIAYSFLSLVFIWKLGLGPLHILMPHIYNSLSPKKILFIDIICKYLLFYTFSRLILSIPININFIALISIIIGSISILKENNLLNILVYSSITNYGLLLISIIDNSIFYVYLVFYSFMTIIFFYLITYIWILYSLTKTIYISLWFILILNLIGIPPLTGFWIKLYVLQLLVINNSYIMIILILISLLLLSSVYIRILLGFIMSYKNIKHNFIMQSDFFNSHFISSLIIFLSFPIFI